MKKSSSLLLSGIFLGCALAPAAARAQVEQTPEVIEAYRVVGEYQRLLAEDDLNFDRAFEATVTRNPARRRAVAIADGEFGGREDLEEVGDELLLKAYRQRMQIFYLMLALAGAGAIDGVLALPPEVEKILKRNPPESAAEFPAFVSRLENDVTLLRSFIDRTARRDPAFAERVRKIKELLRRGPPAPPGEYKIEPLRGYYRSGVLKEDEDYYEIEGYSLVKEEGEMKIIGFRFFRRLF